MNIGLIRRQVGERYFEEAYKAAWLPAESKEWWLKLVKRVPGKKPKNAAGTSRLVETLMALTRAFRAGRARRKSLRKRRKVGCYGSRSAFFRSPGVVSPEAAMVRSVLRRLRAPYGMARVHEFSIAIVRKWLKANAHAYAGLNTYEVNIVDGTARVLEHKSRGDRYGGRASHFRKTDVQHIVEIRSDWFATVYRNGLFNAGGMLTLSATPIEGSCPAAFSASWVVRKGYQLHVEHGYIVCDGGEHYHGETLPKAVRVMKRAREEEVQKQASRRVNELVVKYQEHPEIWDLTVTVEQAMAAGNCETGVLSWISRHFPPDQTDARLLDVLKAGSEDNLARVRRVARYVILKARRDLDSRAQV